MDRTCAGPGAVTYHLASTAHGHLLCQHCGSMTEVPGDMFAALTEIARDRYGFTVAPHRFAVIGICNACH